MSDAPLDLSPSRRLGGFGIPAADGSVVPAGEPPIRFNLKHDALATARDIRISGGNDVATVKRLLQPYCGVPPEHQKLSLMHLDGEVACELTNDRALLSSYNPLHGWTILISTTGSETSEGQ